MLKDELSKLSKESVLEMKSDVEGYRVMMGEYAYEILRDVLNMYK